MENIRIKQLKWLVGEYVNKILIRNISFGKLLITERNKGRYRLLMDGKKIFLSLFICIVILQWFTIFSSSMHRLPKQKGQRFSE